MDIECKYTAGPFAENDEWQTPVSSLAHQILTTKDAADEVPISVAVQWADGGEVTYRLRSEAEQAEADDDAWFEGFTVGCDIVRKTIDEIEAQELDDQDEVSEVEQVGWGRFYAHLGESSWVFAPLSETDNEEQLLDNGWVPIWADEASLPR